MNPKLQEAVSLFKQFGWSDVTADNVLTLPLGTPEQRRAALAGLKSGDWGHVDLIRENTVGWISGVDVDEGKLALFAVRVGVDARRAANVLSGSGKDLIVSVLAERGENYAADFIGYACTSQRRMWEHSASVFGIVAVRLVDRLNLDVPQNVEYLKDWSVYAAAAMGLEAETRYNDTDLPGLDLIEKRFVEHIQKGIAAGVPATGPFGAVLPCGVKRGLLPRENAAELVFSALDAAVRPGDRKVWLEVLDELGISDEELCARTQSLIPLLSFGDAAVITRLAPVLIAGAKGELLMEVLLSAFSAPTKKAKQAVLKSALSCPRPERADDLSPWLSIFAGDKDRDLASLAQRLIKQWDVSAEGLLAEQGELRGLWQKTPPVWTLPHFELGDVSPEALTALAAEIMRRPAMVHDLGAERFWAMANAVAYQDAETARMSLRGLRNGGRSDWQMLDFLVPWVKNERPGYGFDTEKKDGICQPLMARNYVVTIHLDKLPCLLSTPSMVDLSISVPDLASRLALYRQTGTDVLEADLFVALARLNIATKTPEAVKALQQIDVPVVLQSGKRMPLSAGQTVLRYLDDPVKEQLVVEKQSKWRPRMEIIKPSSLRDFPNRFGYYPQELFSLFPHWGDLSLRDVHWNNEVYHEQGLIMRQIARRAAPLPPGAAVNFMASLRSLTPDAAADSMLAVTEAWERGLLRPGVADIAFLDWDRQPVANLAALVAALEGLAADGLLSVVWPILDELLGASLKAHRLIAGTAELTKTMLSLLPEVQAAIEKGLADKAALELPNIRLLANRGGTSHAVFAAKKIVELLPPAKPVKEEAPAPAMERPFDEIWPRSQKAALLIDDGVALTVAWAEPEQKRFLFSLSLPNISDRIFQIVNSGWYYDLEHEGQCQAYAVKPGTSAFTDSRDNQVWLHWDTKKKSIAVCDHRNWVEGNDGPLNRKRVPVPPLPFSLVTVIIGLLAQDGDAIYYAPRLLDELVKNGQVDDGVIRKAMQTFLQNPVVSPAKLLRPLEKEISRLPVLWPMLTECVKAAGILTAADEKPPVWVNRTLDISLRYAPYLAEATKRGLIPAEDAQWRGLPEIASAKAKSTAVTKAKNLLALLSPQA